MRYKIYVLLICCIVNVLFSQEKKTDKDLKVGLVLSGGGAKGLAHIGVLKAIEEAGVRIDYIGGTSMGAIVGAMYATGYSANELDSIFHRLDFDKLIYDKTSRRAKSLHERFIYDRYALALPFNNLKIGIPRSVSKGQNIYNEFVKLLYPIGDTFDFSKLSIPFLCIATDIEKGKQVVLESGFLPKAIMASGAFPSLFDLVEIDGDLLTDGGALNNYPIDEVKAKGMDIIIGVDVQSPFQTREEINSAFGVLSQVNAFAMYGNMPEKIAKTDVYIKPNIVGFNVISFDRGSAIIKRGEKAGFDQIEKLKEIASQQKEKRTPEKIKKIDSIYVKAVHFHGNEHYSRSYLRGKLYLKELERKISFQDLNEGIDNLMATNKFHTVHHQIRYTDEGDHIDFLLRENPERTFVKFGLHYDNLFKTGFIMNYTKHYLFQIDDFFSVDVVLGDNFRYQFDYFVDKGYYTSYGFRSKFNQFYRKIHPDRISKYSIEGSKLNRLHLDAYDWVNQFYFQTLLGNGFVAGIGIENRDISFKTEQVFFTEDFTPLYKEKSNFGSAYSYIKYDSFDNSFFPRRGVYFDAMFHLYLLGKTPEKFNQFSMTKASLSFAIPLFPRLSAKLAFDGGFTLGNAEGIHTLDYFFGGYNKNASNNYIPFYGYDFLSFGGKNFLKTDITLDINHYRKHHIMLHGNVAKVDNELFQSLNWQTSPDFSGYGIGYSLQSVLGPIELKFTYSPELKKPIWLLNIGYWF